MGLTLELNWYLVASMPASRSTTGPWCEEEEDFIETDYYYTVTKDGARIYPIGAVVPYIEQNEAMALVHIRAVKQILSATNKVLTVVEFDKVIEFTDEDPIKEHYTNFYLAYKKKQEEEDHGGTFEVADYLNALERSSFERMLKVQRGESGE